MEPAQAVREDQREGDAQRQVRLEEVEPDEHRLAVGLLEGVDERPAHGLDERPARGERADAQRVLDHDLRELDVAHDRVRPVPVHDGRPLDPAEDLEGHVGRHRVDEHEPALPRARRRDGVQDDDVGLAHAALILLGGLDLERHLRVRLEDLFEEQVPGAHQEDRDLPGQRQHRVRDVVGGEVVVDLEARGHRAAAAVAERQHDGAADGGLEPHLLLGERLAVHLEPERERLRLGRVVDERDVRLVLERAVTLPDREVRDPDVLAAPPHADPPHPRVGGVGPRRQGERAVGEHVDLGARVGGDQRAGGAHGLGEPVRQVARLGGADRGERALAVAAEGGRDLGLDARLDDHHLGALGEPAHEGHRLRPRGLEARRRDVPGLHGRGRVEHDDDLARPVAHDRDRRAREGQGERQERQDLEDQQRIALEPLEERGRLAVAERRIPQEQTRHPPLPAADLEEVEEDERQREPEEGERERREEAHTVRRSRICESTNSSTDVSTVTR